MASYGYTFQAGDTVTPTRLNSARTVSDIVNADIKSDAAIAHSKLANITAGQVLLGNASNVPTATALSGDVTVNSSGVTAIGGGVIVNADVSGSAAIDGTKISPNFGSQDLTTTGELRLGTSSQYGAAGATDPFITIAQGNNATQAGISVSAWGSGGTTIPRILCARSNSSTIGAHTSVVSASVLGSLSFNGSDGTGFVEAARIDAGVEGTPGTNDMPGRLSFWTTADGASAPTERLRISSNGDVVVGKSTANSRLNVAAPDNVTTTYPLRIDNLSNNYGVGVGAYGLSNRVNALNQGIDYTVDIGDDLIINTNGSERIRVSGGGNVGIGSSSVSTTRVRIDGSLTGSTTTFLYVDPTVAPDMTSSVRAFMSFIETAANGGTPYTAGSIIHFQADQGTFHADSTVPNQYGFYIDATFIGATNNYGVRLDIPAGTNRWNLYCGGTANSYFAGAVGIGATVPNAAAALQINSTTQGFLPPRMTTAQRDAIATPPAGLMVYNTTTNKLNFYNGTAWEAVTSA